VTRDDLHIALCDLYEAGKDDGYHHSSDPSGRKAMDLIDFIMSASVDVPDEEVSARVKGLTWRLEHFV
jgi:hypothetical protein